MASAKLSDPQSWNRYSYVLNKPTKFTDPFGLDPQDPILPKDLTTCTMPCKLDPIAVLTIVAPLEPVATTDTQIVTQLQLMTGQANPLPQDGATVLMLDAIASGQGNGVLAGTVAVGTLGSGGTNLPAGAAAATGAILGLAVYDLIRAIGDAISRAIPRSNPPDRDPTVIVRGGEAPSFQSGQVISGAFGSTVYDAASGVPHGQIWHTTANTAEIHKRGSPTLRRGRHVEGSHTIAIGGAV